MTALLAAAALIVRFLLELVLFGALAMGAFQSASSRADGVVRAALLVMAAAALWGQFLSPRRRVELGKAWRLALEGLLFAAAAACVWRSGRTDLAVAFSLIAVLDRAALGLLERHRPQDGARQP